MPRCSHDNERSLSTVELAERWGITPTTLEGWRRVGKGPPWFRLTDDDNGPVRYRLEEIITWEKRGESDQTRA